MKSKKVNVTLKKPRKFNITLKKPVPTRRPNIRKSA